MKENEYFKRQIDMWGEDTQNNLKDKKIIIVGAGGLGSSLILALGTSGIGVVDIIDFDDVSIHNIHRQISFTLKDKDKNKAVINSNLIKSKSPFVKSTPYNMTFSKFIEQNDIKYDLVIDATDNLQTREEIDIYSKSYNTPWVYGSVEAFNGQVCFFENSSFSVFNISNHKPDGNIAPMVMHIASLQANMAIRYLAGLSVDKDRLYYLYFNNLGELITQKFGMPKN